MTPKEKAIELVGKMCGNDCTEKNINKKKKFALIAVDEMLNNDNAFIQTNLQNKYWQEVKNEINKL